jgi:hypothetical protein
MSSARLIAEMYTAPTPSASGIGALIALSLLLGMVGGAVSHLDLVHRLLRTFGMTVRTAHETAWPQVWNEFKDRYVVVEFKDDSRLLGYPRIWSDLPNERCLLLEDACWLIDGVTPEAEGREGVFLVDMSDVRLLEFQRIATITAQESNNGLAADPPEREEQRAPSTPPGPKRATSAAVTEKGSKSFEKSHLRHR